MLTESSLTIRTWTRNLHRLGEKVLSTNREFLGNSGTPCSVPRDPINDFYVIWKGVCHFLLVNNINLGPNSHRFRDTATYKGLTWNLLCHLKANRLCDFLLKINSNLGSISYRLVTIYLLQTTDRQTTTGDNRAKNVSKMAFVWHASWEDRLDNSNSERQN